MKVLFIFAAIALVLYTMMNKTAQAVASVPIVNAVSPVTGMPLTNDPMAPTGVPIVNPNTDPATAVLDPTGTPTGAYKYPTYGVAITQPGPLAGVAQAFAPIAGLVPGGSAADTAAASAGSGGVIVTPVGPDASQLKDLSDLQNLNTTVQDLGFTLAPQAIAPDAPVVLDVPPPYFEYGGKIFEPSGGTPSPCSLLGTNGWGYQPNPPGIPGGKCIPPAANRVPRAGAQALALAAFGVAFDPAPDCSGGGC
jgi:hypothetical protein